MAAYKTQKVADFMYVHFFTAPHERKLHKLASPHAALTYRHTNLDLT